MTDHQKIPCPHSLLHSLFTGILVADDRFHILLVNASTEQILSASSSQLTQLSILNILTPKQPPNKSSPSSQTDLKSQFEHCQRLNQAFVQHNTFITGANEPILVDYAVSPMDNDNGFFYLIEIWAKDRQTMIEQQQRQQAEHEVTRQVIRNMAHEVKNPLAGIFGASQLLQKNLEKLANLDHLNPTDVALWQKIRQKSQEYTDIIRQETERLNTLVNQLLGTPSLPNWQTLNIHQPLEQVLTLVSLPNATSSYAIDFIRDYDLSLPDMLADNDLLVQVFLNLINNAMQALSENNVKNPTITLRTRIAYQFTIDNIVHKSILKIDIIDNGNGIDEALLPQIFYPLVTGRATGTGLGLAVVQDIIKCHQGMITASSRLGKTQFSIYLPWQK